jgi:hypothetical protein
VRSERRDAGLEHRPKHARVERRRRRHRKADPENAPELIAKPKIIEAQPGDAHQQHQPCRGRDAAGDVRRERRPRDPENIDEHRHQHEVQPQRDRVEHQRRARVADGQKRLIDERRQHQRQHGEEQPP